MAVKQNTLVAPSPLDCLRNVAAAVGALVALAYVLGEVADNLEGITAAVIKTIDFSCATWDALMFGLTLSGRSMWFTVAGATVSASVVAWAACVFLKLHAEPFDATAKTFWSERRLILVGIVGLMAYYLFFFAMRSLGLQAFETTHRSIAFFVLHLGAFAPLALCAVGTFIGIVQVLAAAEEAT